MTAGAGQKIRLVLSNGFRYNGVILEETDDLIILKDKFGQRVEIKKNFIALSEEVI